MYVGLTGPKHSKIMIVGEAPGENEDREGLPFSNNGVSGKTLNWLLSQAGINRAECLIVNVARKRPQFNRMDQYFLDKECTMPKPELSGWIQELKEDIERNKPNVVIGLGSYALWALTGEKAISKFRGYTIPSNLVQGQKVICTYHPSNINREFKNFFPTLMDLKKAKFHSKHPQMPVDNRIIIPDASREQFINYCREILIDPGKKVIGLDVETVQPGSHISIIGLGHSRNYAMSTWIMRGMSPCYPENDEFELWYWIARVLEEKEIIIQNASYDAIVTMLNHGIHIKRIHMDTLIAAHIVWPELPRDLGFLASICLDVPPWKHFNTQHPSYYNACDVCNMYGIADVLSKKLNEVNQTDVYNWEMRQLPPAMMLQLQGTLIDEDERLRLLKEVEGIIESTEKGLEELFGKKINYRSSKQLQQLLYTDLNIPTQYKRRKKASDERKITTDKNALKYLERTVKDNPGFTLILEHKKNLTLLNFLNVDISPEGKVHTSYNITGKKIDSKDEDDEGRKSFGRWSSSESIILPFGSGNLQNIPEITRSMYIAPKGFRIITSDYIQAEAVVVAYLSNDRRMISVFKESFGKTTSERKKHKEWDVHILKAADLFSVDINDVTPKMRKVGKTIRHARNYDMGPGTLSDHLGCSLGEARSLLKRDDIANPLLKIWQASIIEELRQTRTLANLFGRQHRFLERWGDSLFKSAFSYKPQSTIGDLMNRSIVRMYEDNEIVDLIHLWLQLHDAVYVLVKDTDDTMYEAMHYLRKHMREVIMVNHEEMIVDSDFKYGYNWKDLREVDYVS